MERERERAMDWRRGRERERMIDVALSLASQVFARANSN